MCARTKFPEFLADGLVFVKVKRRPFSGARHAMPGFKTSPILCAIHYRQTSNIMLIEIESI
jgi:hypothetical protein